MSILTLHDAASLGRLIAAAQSNSRVGFTVEGSASLYGTARRIGDENGANIHGRDVRDALLWVTTDQGFEHFLPIRDLIEALGKTFFILGDT